MRWHKISTTSSEVWDDVVDFDFVNYLSENIILINPTENCVFHGKKLDWDGLPHNRSLFNSPEGCGLPIGNLTSQLFSNIYLSVFDDFMKRGIKVGRYGRYVDDFYVVSNDRDYLRSLIPVVSAFLSARLKLSVNQSKTQICDSDSGVAFIGAYLKPHRRYISHQTLRRIHKKLPQVLKSRNPNQINSYLGVLSHYSAYHFTKRLFYTIHGKGGYFTKWMNKWVEYTR